VWAKSRVLGFLTTLKVHQHRTVTQIFKSSMESHYRTYILFSAHNGYQNIHTRDLTELTGLFFRKVVSTEGVTDVLETL
jgi:hypothetical protein